MSHRPDRRRDPATLAMKLVVFFLCWNALSIVWAQSPTHTSIQQITEHAQQFLEQAVDAYLETGALNAQSRVTVGRLDPRLRLGPCLPEQLESVLENQTAPIGRVTVRVRCNSAAPWSVFVPAQVKLLRDIVVSARPIKRNSLIDSADLMLAEHDIGLLKQGYLLDPSEAIGNVATRALPANQPIVPATLRQPPAVKRGDQVVITAASGRVRVRMPGEALADGSTGQQIRVRNMRSQRIVHARVTGPGQVEVDM